MQLSFPDGLVVRIPGFHPGGPGSIPGMGNFFVKRRILDTKDVFDLGITDYFSLPIWGMSLRNIAEKNVNLRIFETDMAIVSYTYFMPKPNNWARAIYVDAKNKKIEITEIIKKIS